MDQNEHSLGKLSDFDLEKYLRPTQYCDCDHPSILEMTRSLCLGLDDPVQRAVNLFYFVRDSIKSGMDRFDVKASETLAKKCAGCVGKSNLQIALMRAAGIPARYAFIQMSKEVLRPLDTFGLSRLAFTKIPKLLPHAICSVYLEQRWLYAEAAFDQEMYRLFYKSKFGWKIDWDGHSDLLVAQDFFIGDFEYYASMDEQLKSNFGVLPPLFLTRPLFSAANIYSRRMRKRLDDGEGE